MPFPTFVPSISPSPGSSYQSEIKLNESEFGDGYTQASPKGLNHIRDSVSLVWDAITTAERDALHAFFVSMRGCDTFWYQPPFAPATKKWTCKEFSTKSKGAGVHSYECKLVQSFRPG